MVEAVYYETWKSSEIIAAFNLTGEGVAKIFHDCGSYTGDFKIENLRCDGCHVADNKLYIDYIGDVTDIDLNEKEPACMIFIWKDSQGVLCAEFGGGGSTLEERGEKNASNR